MKKRLIYIFLLLITTIYCKQSVSTYPVAPNIPKPDIKEMEDYLPPSLATELEYVAENGDVRYLEKNYTVMIESKVNIFVPLEIVSDVNIDTTVFGDEIVEVPFELEMNKEPERKNYYKLKYSQTKIDIDNDGQDDTFIFSPEYINTRYIKDNYIYVHGGKISKEGEYKKTVYITVETEL